MPNDLKTAPPETSRPLPSWLTPPPASGGTKAGPPKPEASPVPFREIAAVLGTVVVFDLWIYRGAGYSGYAAFFAAACALILWGTPERSCRSAIATVGGLMVLLGARLVWLGTPWIAVLGFLTLFAFAMAATGRRPYVLDTVIHAAQAAIAGLPALFSYGRSIDRRGIAVPRSGWLKVMLPLAMVSLFGTVFVLANPDLATTIGRGITQVWNGFWNAASRFTPSGVEVVLWGVVALCAAGLLRPLVKTRLLGPLSRDWWGDRDEAEPLFESPLYPAYRNTLVAVIGLFAVYLVFEFRTLWFREFPKGFHYSGYAHEGAAWLTVALAMTTIVLSAIFAGPTMRDPRLSSLKRLAWAWSSLNLVLAIAVYNRLFIYIDFNGMTRMRMVGLFGISAVVIGFLLVVVKIAKNYDFAWLIERQLWTLALAIFLLSVLPVDPIVHSYNVRRILAGDPAPSVQISVHPIDAGGLLVLSPLLRSENEKIREGVRAILADADARRRGHRSSSDWTGYQIANHRLAGRLDSLREELRRYDDASARASARQRFDAYAYQWY